MKSKLAISSFVIALVFFIFYFIGTVNKIEILLFIAYILGPLSFILAIASLIWIKRKNIGGAGFAISVLILFLLWFLYLMFILLRLY